MAPDGWHVPTIGDWETLANQAGATGQVRLRGARIAPTNEHPRWAVGSIASTDEFRFSAYPGSYRNEVGTFNAGYGIGEENEFAFFWSATPMDVSTSRTAFLNGKNNTPLTVIGGANKRSGLSIRLIRDNLTGWEEGEQLIDLDENVYDTIKIGDQVWLRQNWACTKYSDGSSMTYLPEIDDWGDLYVGPAYCNYMNEKWWVKSGVYAEHILNSGGFYYENYTDSVYRDFDSGNTGNECIVFHEPTNRWTNIITMYNLNYMDSGNNSLISYIGDKLLVHNHPLATKATFNDTTYGCGTWVYSSEANNINKTFHAIAVHASVKPRIEDVRVYTNQVVGGQMRSKIFYKLINKIEGIFRSAFLRNGWVNSILSKVKLYSGDFLRGKVLKAQISYDAAKDEVDIKSGIDIFKVDYKCESSDY
jgi:uncharacterized protein (TIGR02145 family)